MVKPLLGFSKFFLEWVVDMGILGGAAWLLGGIATFAGAILQRWQSGNLRSYAAWLAAGAAAVLLFLLVPWATVLANLPAIPLFSEPQRIMVYYITGALEMNERM